MKADDVEKGIEIAVELLETNPKIQVDIEDEPLFIKRIAKKFKTTEGKDCICCVYVGIYDDIKDLRIYRRGMKNWAKIRRIPADILEESIKSEIKT
ncbi:MAG: hypothetical protein ACTSR3_18385 [Candidatus Helarchaeota archaeon]